MFDKHFVGLDLTGVEDNGLQRPISRVTLLLDNENSITAGDDTGLELLADCPHATQAMANAILTQIKGYRYRMFSADNAGLDPSAELGDGVTVGGVYSVISRLSDDGGGYAGISAPGEAELEDEYPAGGPITTSFNRKIAQTYSRITKTAEQIRLEVANDLQGLSSSITVELSKITQKVEDTAKGLRTEFTVELEGITSKVTGLNGKYTALEQKVDSFKLTVSNGSTSSTMSLMANGVSISSQTIRMTGLVSFTGLANGTTTIDGACIKTGTIDAEYINLTGAIRWRDLSASVQDDINDAYSMAEDAQSLASDLDNVVGGWTYRGSTYIDGGMIMTGTVMASQLLGGEVGLLDSRERLVGGLLISSTQTGYGVELYTDYGGIRINAGGNFWVDSYNGSFGLTSSGVVCGDNCVPSRTGSYSLGKGGLHWSDVYADNDTIVTSDREKKEAVAYGLDRYAALFDALRPVSFRLRKGQSGRTHLGLIAQDVEAAMEAAGLTGMDFAGLIKSPRLDGEGKEMDGLYDYALRYGEFIALCIAEIQGLKGRVTKLEGSIPV